MSIQESIRQLRIELGLTQEELGNLCKKSAVTVCRWETGASVPTTQTVTLLRKIAEKNGASESCKSYLDRLSKLSRRKGKKAANIGFPELDRDLLCQVVDNAADAVIVLDQQTYTLLYVNKEAEKLAGRSFYEATDKHCYCYMLGKENRCINCPIEHEWTLRLKESILLKTLNHRKYKLRYKGMEWDGRKYFVEYLTDITDLLNAQDEIIRLNNDMERAN